MNNDLKKEHSNKVLYNKFECFVIKHPYKNAIINKEDDNIKKKLWKNNLYDIEDHLLDIILKEKIIFGKMISNSWLKNPFCEEKAIFCEKKIFIFENDYEILKKIFFNENKKKEFFAMFETNFNFILNNKNQYLNCLNKYKLNTVKTVIEALCIFIIWISKYLKKIYISFFLEILIIFLIYCTDQCKDFKLLKKFLIENILILHDYQEIGEKCEKNYFKYLGYSKPLYLSIKEVIKYFLNYLIGNDILSD